MKRCVSVLVIILGSTLAFVALHMVFDDFVMMRTPTAILDRTATEQKADQRSMVKSVLISTAMVSIIAGLAMRIPDQSDD